MYVGDYKKKSFLKKLSVCCPSSKKGTRTIAFHILFASFLTFALFVATIIILLLTVNQKSSSINNSTSSQSIYNVMAGTSASSFSSTTTDTDSECSDIEMAKYDDDFTMYPSLNDAREYQFTTLETNGLRVLAVSNFWSFKSGASLTVEVGSFDDPKDYPGMAHLCEHMTFYGTKKKSESMEFAKYVVSHEGDFNANTNDEQTTYTFFIQPKFFEKALRLFVEMFKHPVFDYECLQKEILAVDQEYQLNVCDDDWAVWELLRRVTNTDSPFHKFQLGNINTLNKSGILEELQKFYYENYSADKVRFMVKVILIFYEEVKYAKNVDLLAIIR